MAEIIDDRNTAASPFHAGEQAIQERLGVRERMADFGRRVIRPYLPLQHREFYRQLPFIVAAAVDGDGDPWVTLITDRPGFVTSPDDRTLRIAALPVQGDPVRAALTDGAPVGLLGIELETRRRNRVTGHLRERTASGVELAVDQSFGNCPQYIQTRTPSFVRTPGDDSATAERARTFTTLSPRLQDWIRRADTCFVASYVPASGDGVREGVDASHRGGRPGFVHVDGNSLTLPDYAGNLHFNTLGNFLLNPRGGLTFVDFESGSLLQLTGTVELLWEDDPLIKAFEGAERGWRFTVSRGVELVDALPLRWRFGEFSPNTLITGDWEQAAATAAAERLRDTWRAHRVVRIEDEALGVRSFWFEPSDGRGTAHYHAGQFLTLRVPAGRDGSLLTRTYTVSSAPHEARMRITVKRESGTEGAEPGAVSSWLHHVLSVGDTIELKAPRGQFWLDPTQRRPAVLLAAGIGVTPMISMARQVAFEGLRTRRIRPLTIVQLTRTVAERPFFGAFRQLADASDGRIRYLSLITGEDPAAELGRDFHGTGRLDADRLRELLALDDYDFYLCGPPGFMQSTYDALLSLGVRDARIQAEAFGPASLVRAPAASSGIETVAGTGAEADSCVVHFTRSGVEQRWNAGDATLLETAEAHGLTPAYGCRAGSCGSCAVRMSRGAVSYRSPVSAAHADDEVLLCCAVPAQGAQTVALDL